MCLIINSIDRPSAIFEIVVLLSISFILGFVCARVPLNSEKNDSNILTSKRSNKRNAKHSAETIDPRDIITEPTSIQAILTRDRKGNAIAPPSQKKDPTN